MTFTRWTGNFRTHRAIRTVDARASPTSAIMGATAQLAVDAVLRLAGKVYRFPRVIAPVSW